MANIAAIKIAAAAAAAIITASAMAPVVIVSVWFTITWLLV